MLAHLNIGGWRVSANRAVDCQPGVPGPKEHFVRVVTWSDVFQNDHSNHSIQDTIRGKIEVM